MRIPTRSSTARAASPAIAPPAPSSRRSRACTCSGGGTGPPACDTWALSGARTTDPHQEESGSGDHVAILVGAVMNRIQATFATEDWGGLRQSHFRLLSQVPPEGIRITDLAARLVMTKQGGGQFVTFLAGTGHLRVERDPHDRRARIAVRTPTGDRVVADATARIRRIEREWAGRPGRAAALRRVPGRAVGAGLRGAVTRRDRTASRDTIGSGRRPPPPVASAR